MQLSIVIPVYNEKNNIKQIDLIERNKKNFYRKWTEHFRNYNFLYRKNFKKLYKEILVKIN